MSFWQAGHKGKRMPVVEWVPCRGGMWRACSLVEHVAEERRLFEEATDSGTGSSGLRQQAGLSLC